MSELVTVARRVLEEWDDPALQDLVDRTGTTGVAGELKNLVFASTGPKPQIVLRDAVNNAMEIARGAETCLIFNRPLPEGGLTWPALVDWWGREHLKETNTDLVQRHLYQRLAMSLASDAEQLLFRTYTDRLVADATGPALLPQVYLHYDPYFWHSPDRRPGSVVRQRMDFLMLLSTAPESRSGIDG